MGGSDGQPRAVVAHDAGQVAAVLALGRPVRFLSAAGALGFQGADWFAAVLRGGGAGLGLGVGDAGGAPGFALAGLRAGLGAVVLDPACPAFPALAVEAGRRGALLLAARPPALDLMAFDLARPKARARLLLWLG
jgi:hypothetical protein